MSEPAEENSKAKAGKDRKQTIRRKKKIIIAQRRAKLIRELELHPAVSMPELASRFKVSEATVYDDFRKLLVFYRERAMQSREAWIGEILRRHESIYSKAETGWLASLKPVKTTKRQVGGEGGGFESVEETTMSGDGKFLVVQQNAMTAISKLLGLDAARKVDVNVSLTADAIPKIAALCVRFLSRAGGVELVGEFRKAVMELMGGSQSAGAKTLDAIAGPARIAEEAGDGEDFGAGEDDADGEDDDFEFVDRIESDAEDRDA